MLNALGFDVGKEDGILGAQTSRAIRDFQRNVAARVDGIVGLDTVRSLEGMRPPLEGPGRTLVREAEAARTMGAGISGTVVAIDPGHGPVDRGQQAGDVAESDVTWRVGRALADELERRGAHAIVLRAEGEDPEVGDRARRANAAEASVCVSLHLGGGELAARGVVCCYYGTPTTHSPMGLHLAEAVRAELVARGMPDGGVRPLAIAILRETRMPAVQVELAVITDERELERARDEGLAPLAAAGVAEGIERFLGARGDPQPRAASA